MEYSRINLLPSYGYDHEEKPTYEEKSLARERPAMAHGSAYGSASALAARAEAARRIGRGMRGVYAAVADDTQVAIAMTRAKTPNCMMRYVVFVSVWCVQWSQVVVDNALCVFVVRADAC